MGAGALFRVLALILLVAASTIRPGFAQVYGVEVAIDARYDGQEISLSPRLIHFDEPTRFEVADDLSVIISAVRSDSEFDLIRIRVEYPGSPGVESFSVGLRHWRPRVLRLSAADGWYRFTISYRLASVADYAVAT